MKFTLFLALFGPWHPRTGAPWWLWHENQGLEHADV